MIPLAIISMPLADAMVELPLNGRGVRGEGRGLRVGNTRQPLSGSAPSDIGAPVAKWGPEPSAEEWPVAGSLDGSHGSQLGDVTPANVHTLQVRWAAVIASVVIERLIVSVPFALLLAVSGWMLPLPPELARWRLIVLGAVAAMIVGLLLLARPGRQRDPGIRKASSWRLRAADAVRRFRAAVRDLLSTGRTSLVLGLAVAHWALQLIAIVSVAAALQFPLPLAGSLLALLGMSASGSVRLSRATWA